MNATELEPWVEIVRQRVAGLRYGSVQITIHDGRVTQVEATEKTRLAVGTENERSAPDVERNRSTGRRL
jgi:hypothetical protein